MKENLGLIFLVVGILLFAFLPHHNIPTKIDSINANLLHIFAFSVLSIYLYYIKKYQHKKVFLFILAIGIFIEIIQGLFTTNREASIFDILYDISSYIVVASLITIKDKLSKI